MFHTGNTTPLNKKEGPGVYIGPTSNPLQERSQVSTTAGTIEVQGKRKRQVETKKSDLRRAAAWEDNLLHGFLDFHIGSSIRSLIGKLKNH